MSAVECLDANAVQVLMSGVADDAARRAALGHLDTCSECRELLAAVATDAVRQDVAPVSSAFSVESAGDIALRATVPRSTRTGPSLIIPGTVVGRYTLEAKLGEGGMGVVWRAHDPQLGRQVAIKLLKRRDRSTSPPGQSQGFQFMTRRLVAEAQLMARLSHPNVARVYDVGVADDMTYIAMELVTGTNLRSWRAAAPRTIPHIVAIYIAAGRGLSAAHAAGIVHRDFKPDNVLVGDDGRVCVTDFGLAAARRSEDVVPRHSGFDWFRLPRRADREACGVSATGGSATEHNDAIGDGSAARTDQNHCSEVPGPALGELPAGAVFGTPGYMAPEQFCGGNIDSRTDQFSFCASLYEALSGERPFDGSTLEILADNVISGRIKPMPKQHQISRGLRAIVMRGMSTKPGDRFPTMDHLLAELGRDRARPWRRSAIGAAALSAALALGLGADWAVRTRVAIQIQQSFHLTGKQLDLTAERRTRHFHDVSAIAYREPALREVTGHHDQADFFLGTATADREALERLHNILLATEWKNVGKSQRAIVDYKGRLLYTSYAPHVWNTDTRALPPIKRALDAGKGDSVTILSTTDPALVSSGILGHNPDDGLVIMFARVLALGDSAANRSEARAIYLEFEDAAQLLDDLRLDDDTSLAIIANDGKTITDAQFPSTLVSAALPGAEIATHSHDGTTYQLQSRVLRGLGGDGQIARVVMARKLDGVLQLFPGASAAFSIAALVALTAAAAMAFRARQIAGPRIG